MADQVFSVVRSEHFHRLYGRCVIQFRNGPRGRFTFADGLQILLQPVVDLGRKSMMGLVRRGKAKVRGSGFIVTWDVDSRDRPTVNRLMAFLYGRRVQNHGKEYVYQGFVMKDGVRYVGQSTIFVLRHRLEEIRSFLSRHGVDHEVTTAWLS